MDDSRTNTQKLVTLHVDHALFEATEMARGRVNRSQWIRDAIAEKCMREGIPVPEDATLAPDRGRKGSGWAAEVQRKASHMLNDTSGGEVLPSLGSVKYPKGKSRKSKTTNP